MTNSLSHSNKIPIVVVEDNEDDIELMLRAFRKTGGLANPLVIFRDGEQVLEYFANPGSVMPALVILDLKLPKIGGLAILEKLRAAERTRLLPVVILTSSTEESDLVTSYTFGANSYIRKPVDFGEFVKTISSLGLYWLVLNEIPKLS